MSILVTLIALDCLVLWLISWAYFTWSFLAVGEQLSTLNTVWHLKVVQRVILAHQNQYSIVQAFSWAPKLIQFNFTDYFLMVWAIDP